MINGMTELMRLHPASRFGGPEHRPSDPEVFEEQESRHPRPRHDHQAGRRDPARRIRNVALAATMLVAFAGVLTLVTG